jgi:RNA polymerase sigma factor (sigma-70 family)
MVKPAADWTERSLELSRLLARAGLGDRAAFATLYEWTSSHLFAVVLRINRDSAQAEDILQEVYVNVWRAARSFDAAQSQPLTWLTSIARNRAIDSLRRVQTQPQMQTLGNASGGAEHEDENVYDNVADKSPGPLDLLSRASDARALTQCMEQLSALQRQSLALAFYQGLSHAEVAEQLRQPLGTVKSWVRRALMTLKGCLQGAVQRDGAAHDSGAD